ncbi:MAG TPA: glycine betaine/L-proline ABC transporter ATP-binding protein [Trueperaceae bacterium]|nr:glycine betaine/L-proline ABC transporter ATP-binding protein [Trueperaceae bacterium]
MAFIEIRNLSKVFGPQAASILPQLSEERSKEEVLQQTGHTVGLYDISLDIERGETFVVMGLSGSGKSTLVRCLNRLIEPTAGSISVGDVDVLALDADGLRDARRRRFGMVFQRFGLLPHRTVLENVAFGLRVRNVGKEERLERAGHWIEVVGLSGYEHSRPQALSGGMQQRVGLARALATDPDVLLMDEAFSALDPLIRREMQDELMRIQRDLRKTIVFITHDLDEALRLGDRVAILNHGRLVQVSTPAGIVLSPATDYVRAFVEHVNRARVLRVRHIMEDAVTVSLAQRGSDVTNRLLASNGLAAFVQDARGRYQGTVSFHDAGQNPERPVAELLREEALTLAADMLLEDAMEPLGDSQLPAAVVGDDGRLLGMLRPRAVLLAMGANRVADSFTSKLGTAGQGAAQPSRTEAARSG